jgi:hypothetical protein
MRLCTLRNFRSLVYEPDSAPSMATLRARADRGEIPGACWQGSRRYIDLDVYDHATGLSTGLEAEIKRLEKTPELEGLL